MNKALLGLAVAAGLAAPAMAQAEVVSRSEPAQGPLLLPGYGSKGKGKGKRPYHPSRRFVAMDKRDARKARNRRRS